MPGMTDPSLDPIFAYLREHSGRYSYSALREQLLQKGYEPAAVDQAIAICEQESGPEPVWPKSIPVAAVNSMLIGFTVMNLLWRTFGPGFPGGVVALIVVAEIPVGLVLTLFPASRIWGRALINGFLLSVALGLLVLTGICLFSANQSGSH